MENTKSDQRQSVFMARIPESTNNHNTQWRNKCPKEEKRWSVTATERMVWSISRSNRGHGFPGV